jgi:phosphocarrier protein
MEASQEVTIINKYGFHARPSTTFSQLARCFKSVIKVETNGLSGDGKSVMGLMSLGAPQGTVIRIIAQGEDAIAAVKALSEHVTDRFGGIE